MGTEKDGGRGRKGGSAGISADAHWKVVAANRKAWTRYSEERKRVLKAARRETVKFNKDGRESARAEVTYLCAHCHYYYPLREVQIDHREPVGTTAGWPPGEGRSWDDWLKSLWCAMENLQVLCTTCHRAKTNDERKQRANKLSNSPD